MFTIYSDCFRFRKMVEKCQVVSLIVTCTFGMYIVLWGYSAKWNSNNLSTLSRPSEVAPDNASDLEPCTFHLISEHLRIHTKFITSGKWMGHNHNQISENNRGYYNPGICSLKRKEDNSPWLWSCLYETKINNILFLGDSNSRKATNAFLATLEEREGFTCEETSNRTQRDDEGHLTMLKVVVTCQWIYERDFSCKKKVGDDLSSTLTVNVQYVKMWWLRENVSFVSESTAPCPDVANKSVHTFQEYILGEFAERTKPDLIILPATAHTRYVSVKQWTEDQKWLMKKADDMLPKSTFIVWLSHMSWRDDKLPPNNQHVNRVEDSGSIFTINQQVLRHNIIFHQLINTIIHSNHTRVKVLPFFDLYNISLPVQRPWYNDWIHGNKYFYNGIQDVLFETLCNSFTKE